MKKTNWYQEIELSCKTKNSKVKDVILTELMDFQLAGVEVNNLKLNGKIITYLIKCKIINFSGTSDINKEVTAFLNQIYRLKVFDISVNTSVKFIKDDDPTVIRCMHDVSNTLVANVLVFHIGKFTTFADLEAKVEEPNAQLEESKDDC